MVRLTTQLEQLENAQLVRRALDEDFSYCPYSLSSRRRACPGPGDYALALNTFDELLGHFANRGMRADQALVLWLKGQALAGLNRRGQVHEFCAEARAVAEARGSARPCGRYSWHPPRRSDCIRKRVQWSDTLRSIRQRNTANHP